jgi:hypothetical protein
MSNIPNKNADSSATYAIGTHLRFFWDLIIGIWNFAGTAAYG